MLSLKCDKTRWKWSK